MTSREIALLKLTKRIKDHSTARNSPLDTFELMLDIAKLNIEILDRLEKYLKDEK